MYTGEELDFAVAEGMKLIGFKLTLLPEQNDYANCAGEYMEYPDVVVRDWPIYYNEDKNRIAFYSGSKWKVTSMNYLEAIKGGATGGFYGGQTTTAGPATKMVWRPRYSVRGKYGRT